MSLIKAKAYYMRTGELRGKGVISSGASELVTVEGSPASRTVRLYHSRSGWLIQTQRSKPDGTFRFSGLNPDLLFKVEAYDDVGIHNAVVADFVKPVIPT
ncbi:hypothetical protein [Algiphilus sp.]|uniref:hypothetical protein n=1 Tax=Algiphilus sp. TaxID=1872431 RepID=UPI003BAC4850